MTVALALAHRLAPAGPCAQVIPAEHIVVVLHDLPLGGTERIALRLAAAWAARGRRVTLFVGAREGALAPLVDPAVKVVECDPPIRRARGSRRRLAAALATWIAAHRPNAVFFAGNYQWPAIPALPPGEQRPAFFTQVSTPLYRHGRGPIRQIGYNLQTRRRLRPVDAVVALSPEVIGQADRILGRRITCCIPLPALEDSAAALRPASGRLILAAGRLAPEKGFDVALRAFAQLDDPEARLVILGEGDERGRLEALAHALGIGERVTLPGCVSDIRPWLQEARLLLLSSWYEGYAAVVIEALAAGRPVVATACTPAAQELLRGSSARGRVTPVGDAPALAVALRDVLDAPPPGPDDLALAVARFRIGPIADAYLDLFDAVVAERRRPAMITMGGAPRAQGRGRWSWA